MIRRRKPIKRKGKGSAFPHRRDPKYMAWLLDKLAFQRPPCDGGCGRPACLRAHIKPRSRGGDDRNNVVLLDMECDWQSEKRMDRWMAEHPGVDLYATAKRWTAQYDAERGTE